MAIVCAEILLRCTSTQPLSARRNLIFTGASETHGLYLVPLRLIDLVVPATVLGCVCSFLHRIRAYSYVIPPTPVATRPVAWYHPEWVAPSVRWLSTVYAVWATKLSPRHFVVHSFNFDLLASRPSLRPVLRLHFPQRIRLFPPLNFRASRNGAGLLGLA